MNYEHVPIPQPSNKSVRRYQGIRIHRGRNPGDPVHPNYTLDQQAFIDELTGIITVDVAKFEQWIEEK